MSLWIFCNIAMKTKVNPPLDFEKRSNESPRKDPSSCPCCRLAGFTFIPPCTKLLTLSN